MTHHRFGKSFRISALLGLALLTSTGNVLALSEIQNEEAPPAAAQPQAPATGQTPATPAPAETQPSAPADQTPPATGTPTQSPAAEQPAPAEPNAETPQLDEPGDQPTTDDQSDPDDPGQGAQNRPDVDPNAPLPQVEYDLAKLPEPVRRMRDKLVEAAKSGDPEKLRVLLQTGATATQLSLADQNEDPIKFLISQSGDQAGQEILAILEEVLEAGYVHLDAGTPEELYVWPYFFAYPLDRLTPQQKVEIYRIVTASDFEEMEGFGNYIFYRVGIAPDGRWAFFVAGE